MRNKTPKAFAFAPVVRGQNSLRAKASGDAFDIELIGTVGKSYWDESGITEKEFRNALRQIPNDKPITLKINSEGGSVQEGLGIYNAIRERRDDITATITGYALSIASVFPLGAGKVVSPKSAIWMMHKAWSWTQGNADDMRQAADMLDTHDETLVDIYAENTGKSKADIRSAMEAETWIKGSEAVEFGLADEGDPEESVEDAAQYRPLASGFLDRCKNISPEILNCLQPISAAPINGGQQTPTKDNAMKKNIVALLKKHGIDATETETEEQLQAKLDKIPMAKAEGDNHQGSRVIVDITTRLEAQEAAAKAERLNRITDKVSAYVGTQQITKAEVPIFVQAALADEAGTITILDGRPMAEVGGAPVGSGGIEVLDGPMDPEAAPGLTGLRGPQSEMLVNIRKEHKTPKARHAAVRDCYAAAMAQAIKKDVKAGRSGQVFAANTYSGTLMTSFLMDGSLTDLVHRWAMLRAYSRDYSIDPYKPLATGVLKHVTAGEATQTNPTNFEPATGSTVAPISITMNWYNQPVRVAATDLNQGLRLDDLRIKAIATFSDTVVQAATAPITAANFTATPLISAPAAFGWSDAQTLRGQLKKSPIKNLVIDGDYLARLENVPTNFQNTGIGDGARSTFGWDGMYENTNWTGAGNNIRGFACNPQALVAITGLPLNPPNIPGGVFSTTTAEVPGLEIALAMSTWFSLASRTMFVSWDLVAGFAAGDLSAGIVVASGTPS